MVNFDSLTNEEIRDIERINVLKNKVHDLDRRTKRTDMVGKLLVGSLFLEGEHYNMEQPTIMIFQHIWDMGY